MDMSNLSQGDNSGLTSEGKLQAEIAGCERLLHFSMEDSMDQIFHSEVFKEGVTFEWVKNKVAEKLEAQY